MGGGDDTLRMTPLPGEVYCMFSSRAVEFTVYIDVMCYYMFFLVSSFAGTWEMVWTCLITGIPNRIAL